MNKSLVVVFITSFVTLLATAAENSRTWERYDESADLALLGQHENERMHFKLLNSKVLDKNFLWAPFADDLANFSEATYISMKPMILDRSIGELQQSVSSGALTYEQLVTSL